MELITPKIYVKRSYGGKREMHEGNIEIIPIKDALKNLPELLS